MTAPLVLKAETARKEWRETIDAAYAGKQEVVIKRYGAPIVTIVNHEIYEAQKKRLADLETLLMHRKVREEVEKDPSQLIFLEDFSKLLIAAGLPVPASQN
jgi:hypothetical protein